MYRTDKKFMRNPATASSRIYIGYLQESVLPEDLERKFKVHGTILGLVLQRGFAFIQYENEAQAQAAISKENGQVLFGRNVVVRRAIERKRNNSPPPAQTSNVNNNPQPLMSIKPVEEVELQPPPNVNIQSPVQQQQQNIPQPPPEPIKQQDGGPPEKRRRPFKREPERLPPFVDNYREGPPYYPRDEVYQAPPPQYNPPIIDRPERNDCEIIVVSKALTEYAEYIEQRLKALNLIVDLLFPNEDVPIGRVLANISSRGCLYAILVMPQNEEHRSLTLNILHGVPQEHRNMPIEDALILISRNFDAYMRGEQTGPASTGSDSLTLSDRHPEPIQMLLNLLAENRQITTVQYDRLMKYLQERRDLQSQFEIAEGIDTNLNDVNSKQAELQNRIMNILNKSSDSPKPVAPPTLSSTATAQTPLLNDPTVQKALDSLLSGDMFKSISAAL